MVLYSVLHVAAHCCPGCKCGSFLWFHLHRTCLRYHSLCRTILRCYSFSSRPKLSGTFLGIKLECSRHRRFLRHSGQLGILLHPQKGDTSLMDIQISGCCLCRFLFEAQDLGASKTPENHEVSPYYWQVGCSQSMSHIVAPGLK